MNDKTSAFLKLSDYAISIDLHKTAKGAAWTDEQRKLISAYAITCGFHDDIPVPSVGSARKLKQDIWLRN